MAAEPATPTRPGSGATDCGRDDTAALLGHLGYGVDPRVIVPIPDFRALALETAIPYPYQAPLKEVRPPLLPRAGGGPTPVQEGVRRPCYYCMLHVDR